MAFKIHIRDLKVADRNEEAGLYHFVATLSDNTQCRLVYSKKPEWKLIGINRLLSVPCPVCRKDYYCNCLSNHADELEREIIDKELIKL